MNLQSHTVIIPTRERCETLVAALRSATSQDYERLQIIVSDNFSQDETEQVSRSARDKRILYINPGKRLSMSTHWEFALAHATNDWITIIGDDDALLPACLKRVDALATEYNVSAIRTSVCQFRWPGFKGSTTAKLSVPTKSGAIICECRKQLNKTLYGWDSYRSLPMIYNGGFVRRTAIEAAHYGGRFYHSSIPDVFSGVMLSHTLDRFLFSYEPLAVNGASSNSTGASTFSGEKDASSPSSQFLSEGNIAFHASVPMTDDNRYPPSLPAMLYESLAQVSDFRSDAIQISPSVQLRVILATARKDRKKLTPWAKKFAESHNLHFERELALSKIHSACYSLRRKLQRLSRSKDAKIDGQNAHMPDSYHASLVAAEILAEKRDSQIRRVA